VVSGFSVSSSSSSTTTTTLEDQLVARAVPLPPCENPAQSLLDSGVCRINGVIPTTTCHRVREHILSSLLHDEQQQLTDFRYIPQTRLRFSEPWPAPLNQRVDLLLPIEDETIGNLLQELASSVVGTTLAQVADQILPSTNNNDETTTTSSLELVEVACLVSYPGATHQVTHADFHRHWPNASKTTTTTQQQQQDRLPSRLVTFLYLQDTPTTAHGPTLFLPGTNNPASHEQFYGNGATTATTTATVHAATLQTGDCAVYDASLLHFGSANSVPDNTRAVFYFGVALGSGSSEPKSRENTMAKSSSQQQLTTLPPIRLVASPQHSEVDNSQLDDDKTMPRSMRFLHPVIRGMTDQN